MFLKRLIAAAFESSDPLHLGLSAPSLHRVYRLSDMPVKYSMPGKSLIVIAIPALVYGVFLLRVLPATVADLGFCKGGSMSRES